MTDASTVAAVVEPGIALAAAGYAYLRRRARREGTLEEILKQLERIAEDHEGRIRLLEAKHA